MSTHLPKLGDRVCLAGHSGTFEVIAVVEKQMQVDLKLIGAATYVERGIPSGVLLFRDKKCP